MKKFKVVVNGNPYFVEVEEIQAMNPVPAAKTVSKAASPQTPQNVSAPAGIDVAAPAGSQVVNAPMPGKILAVNVKKGDSVKQGDVLCILEAMKMQNDIIAPKDGIINEILITAGQSVTTGKSLFYLQ
ncbi:biotin/lipoyl attachment [Lucifera butyrica]|uniref:Biotin/lipoyl attachment n=1 Tax=Lucifera butyrica TaxID=1351585 RepID=A0A498RFH7_9FIRM|nr:biotin/lipoyl-containing protein [Lucifera butyrica]VBB07848.1 biotin/lipoyl attachment [Lucifera butyrica]